MTPTREQFIDVLELVDGATGPMQPLSHDGQIVLSHYDHLRAQLDQALASLKARQERLAWMEKGCAFAKAFGTVGQQLLQEAAPITLCDIQAWIKEEPKAEADRCQR